MAAQAFTAPVVNVPPATNNAKVSWDPLPKATTPLRAPMTAAKSHVNRHPSAPTYVTACNKTSLMEPHVAAVVAAKTVAVKGKR